jgi:5-methyltetrahydrofolate--homocysteine methyltransferase
MEQIAAKKSGKPTNGKPAVLPQPKKSIIEEEGSELSGLEAKIALAPKVTGAVKRTIIPAAVPKAPFYGTKVIEDVPLDEIFSYINEVALIRGQWQVRKGKLTDGEYQELLVQQIYPELARLKEEAKSRKVLQPKVVYGYHPCQSDGDDLIIYDPQSADIRSARELLRFTFPRQTKGRHFCISDFFASKDSGTMDVVAFHLVTMGKVASEHTQKLFSSNNYKEYLYFHGLSVECAEALAELWHKKIREELGIAQKDSPEIKKLFSQQYQGSRYSFGYPACPSLEDQAKLFELLEPERIGVSLTEEFQLVPEQSTSAIIVHHPEAKYFNI